MWQDLVTGFLAAPLWAQIGMACFLVMAVVMLVAPKVTLRRHAARFAALAAAAGVATTRHDEFTESLAQLVDGRRYEVRREFRVRGRASSSYRGPTGHVLVTATPLAGSRWEMHQLDIAPGRLPSLFGAPPLATGDAVFDGRFLVRQDGIPVRDNWLDGQTRAAVTAFFDTPGATGPIWVQGQQLVHVMSPWLDVDHAALARLLAQQTQLASALERTAGWRGPAA